MVAAQVPACSRPQQYHGFSRPQPPPTTSTSRADLAPFFVKYLLSIVRFCGICFVREPIIFSDAYVLFPGYIQWVDDRWKTFVLALIIKIILKKLHIRVIYLTI